MRYAAVLILGCVLSGCAASQRAEVVRPAPAYAEASASALVFSPPVVRGEPAIALWRDQRAPAAFVGFDELTTYFSYIRTDDRDTNDGTGFYLRRAIMERTGVSYR